VVTVTTAAQLQNAIANLASNGTIIIEPGTYRVSDSLYLPQNISNVTIKGSTGNRDDVVIQGGGMNGSIRFGFWIGAVQNAVFQDLSVKGFANHALIFNQGAQAPQMINVHLIDAAQEFIKVNPLGINNGVLKNSLIEYTTAAPTDYTNGLDVHNGSDWVVRNNTFKNFKTPGALAGPAVLFWNASSNAVIEGNVFIDNQRDIQFGLDPNKTSQAPVSNGSLPDNSGGLIVNNFIVRNNAPAADVAIGVWDSPNTKVYYNTILMRGGYPNAIEYRYARTTGVDIRDNLTDGLISAREGATGTVSSNVTTATTSMFVNTPNGDLHLLGSATGAIGKGVAVSTTTDIDGQTRISPPDVGADQYSTSATPPSSPAPSLTCPTIPSASSSTGASVMISYVNPVVTGGAAPVTTSWSYCVPAVVPPSDISTTPPAPCV